MVGLQLDQERNTESKEVEQRRMYQQRWPHCIKQRTHPCISNTSSTKNAYWRAEAIEEPIRLWATMKWEDQWKRKSKSVANHSIILQINFNTFIWYRRKWKNVTWVMQYPKKCWRAVWNNSIPLILLLSTDNIRTANDYRPQGKLKRLKQTLFSFWRMSLIGRWASAKRTFWKYSVKRTW
jgi:hypothetical protein